MVPYKRPAADKSGMPVYQPNATTYQQLMQLQQPPFVPVSCEYSTPPATVTSSSLSPATPSCSSVASSSGGAAEVGKVVVTELEETASPVANDKLPQGSKPPLPVPVPVTMTIPAPPLPTPAVTPTDMAAAAAKEAAQQSYAKAFKLAAAAAASSSLPINPLMALNYTGVALNKQAMAVLPPPPPRYAPHIPSLSLTPTTQIPTHLPSQLVYSQTQPNLLAYSRAPPPPATLVSPYTFLRPQLVHATPFAMVPQPPPTAVVGNGILNNVMSQYNPLAASANNNNIVTAVALQPYKKMKTT